MLNTNEIRRINLRLLASRLGGLTALGNIIDKNSSQMSQIIGPKPTRNIGELLARQIERKLVENKIEDIFLGWMDVDYSSKKKNNSISFENLATHSPTEIQNISCLLTISDKSTLPDKTRLFDEALKEQINVITLDHGHSFWLKIDDDTMKPFIEPGTLAMIDTTKNKPEHGLCYAILLDDKIVLRRVYKDFDKYKICCDNPSVKIKNPDIIVEKFTEKLKLLGKLIWSSTAH